MLLQQYRIFPNHNPHCNMPGERLLKEKEIMFITGYGISTG